MKEIVKDVELNFRCFSDYQNNVILDAGHDHSQNSSSTDSFSEIESSIYTSFTREASLRNAAMRNTFEKPNRKSRSRHQSHTQKHNTSQNRHSHPQRTLQKRLHSSFSGDMQQGSCGTGK